MGGNLAAGKVQRREHDDILAVQFGSIEPVLHFHPAGRLFDDEGHLRFNRLAVHRDGFAGRLVHQDSFDRIQLVDQEIVKRHDIREDDIPAHFHFLFPVFVGCGRLQRGRQESDRLTFILDIRVRGDLHNAFVQPLEHNDGFAA